MENAHLLDGTSLSYTYNNGAAAEVSFEAGKFRFKWTAGPLEGLEGTEGYRALRICDKRYALFSA